jgi:hypothetical protein
MNVKDRRSLKSKTEIPISRTKEKEQKKPVKPALSLTIL